MNKPSLPLILAAVIITILVIFTTKTFASTFVVDEILSTMENEDDNVDDNPGDGICRDLTTGHCTLTAALHEAYEHTGADTITFSVNGTISMDNGSDFGRGDLTIQGNGTSSTIITSLHLNLAGTAISNITLENLSLTSADTIECGTSSSLTFNSVSITNPTTFTNSGTMTISSSTIDGALTNNDSLLISNSFISQQIVNNEWGTAEITNTTISNSTSSGIYGNDGGGISNLGGTVYLSNVTIANNSALDLSGNGGGIYNTTGSLYIKNSIIANNTATLGNDCYGTIISEGYNLIEDTSGCTITGTTTGNVTGSDPLLGSLADNGGETQTLALLNTNLPTSPAIDAGNPAGCTDIHGTTLTTDQRGSGYSRDYNSRCDIGAYEYHPAVCSNGIVEGDEECDDGNTADEDSCNSSCRSQSIYYYDMDSDGYGSDTYYEYITSDDPQIAAGTFVTSHSDCDDSDATINITATEICGDGIDQDCSGSDESCAASGTDTGSSTGGSDSSSSTGGADSGSSTTGTDSGSSSTGTDSGSSTAGTDSGSSTAGTDSGSSSTGTDTGFVDDSGDFTDDNPSNQNAGTSGASAGGCQLAATGTSASNGLAVIGVLGSLPIVRLRRSRRTNDSKNSKTIAA